LNYLSIDNINKSTQDMSNCREDFDLTFSGKNKNNSVYFEDEVVINRVKNSHLISFEDLKNYSASKNPNLKLNLNSIVNKDKDKDQSPNIDKNKS